MHDVMLGMIVVIGPIIVIIHVNMFNNSNYSNSNLTCKLTCK